MVITIDIGGAGMDRDSLALIVVGIIEKSQLKSPKFINDIIKDNFENVFC